MGVTWILAAAMGVRSTPRRCRRATYAAYSGAMARIILFVIAAVVGLVLLWVLFWNFLHLLILGFWLLLVVLLGFGLFRVGRWSASKRKRA